MSTKLRLRDAGRMKDVSEIDFSSTFSTIPLADMVPGLPSMEAVCDDGKLVVEKTGFWNGDFFVRCFWKRKNLNSQFL